MRGQGTAETEKASADENARITLETIRHAAVGNLRHPPKGCEELIKTHFRVTRERMLLRCKEACDNAPSERLRKATLKASMDLRLELDRLTAEGGGDAGGHGDDGSEG